MLTMAGQRFTWRPTSASAMLLWRYWPPVPMSMPGRRTAQNNLPLHAAAAGKHRALVDLLLGSGADVNARQEGGWTALHAAAQDGDTPMIASLLAHGADANARNDAGQTPLTIARSHGQAEAVELLGQHGGVE